MRILLTGASGMLGATLVKQLYQEYDIYATGASDYEIDRVKYKKFDLENGDYYELIKWSKPQLIIHSGAITNGNYCQSNPLKAFNVNGLSLKKLIDFTDETVKIIYISSDAVFPSKLHLATERDCVDPENIYGKSKELGEFFLKNSDRDYLIIRTTIVGLNENKTKNGFVEWIINSVTSKESIGLFGDVLFNPISIWDLTKEILFLIKNNYINSQILHIAGSEICSKFHFGTALLNSLGFSLDFIKETEIADFKKRAKRCTDQTLDCSMYCNKYNRVLPNLIETVNSIKINLNV